MAGGIGSRFWPVSRTGRPKQFLDILGVGKSLIRLTFERFLKLCPADNIYVLTNAAYRALVLEQLPEIRPEQVLGEPSRNNTAPCAAYAAFKLQGLNPDANLVLAPSDHIILKEDIFLENLRQALAFTAENAAICTLGIQPTRPDTGYGYIHFERESYQGVHKVRAFKEKPPLETARAYFESGEYLWNAGIFVFRAHTLLRAFERYAPEIHRILGAGAALYNTPEEEGFLAENYPKTPSISIDYAIMEKADNVFTIPSDIGWSDLGTWASLHAESPKDEGGNVVQSRLLLADNVSNCLIRAPGDKLLVLKDLDGYIVVDEGDVLLVYPKSKEQEIRKVTEEVQERFGERFS